MELNQLQNSEQIAQTGTDILVSGFSTEDLKHITDFFSILIKIDKRLRSKEKDGIKNK